MYGSGASSASGSALSLSLPGLGIGRRRGNSGASNLHREITAEDPEPPTSKGKGVDRGHNPTMIGSSPIDFARASGSGSGVPVARHLDTTTPSTAQDAHLPSPSPTAPDKPSHLRQMSNASSPASSYIESVPGSLRNELHTHGSSSTLDSPNASGVHIAASHTPPDNGGDANGNAGAEPMFNFQSLAAMIGEDGKEDKEDATRHIEHLENTGEGSRHTSRDETADSALEESVATLTLNGIDYQRSDEATTRNTTLLEPQRDSPEVMLTAETPAALDGNDEDGKQLGANWTETTSQITQ